MHIELKATDFIPTESALRLSMANESEIVATFSLNHIPKKAVLCLSHKALALKNGTSFAPISIRVNEQIVSSGLNPSSNPFDMDLLNISKWLILGENKVELILENAKTHYLIKKLIIKY